MLRMLVQNTVQDYATWRAVFEENTHTFAPAGLSLEWVRRNPDNPNEVWFCLLVQDRAKAESYLSDPAHAQIGQRATVTAGQITYLTDD